MEQSVFLLQLLLVVAALIPTTLRVVSTNDETPSPSPVPAPPPPEIPSHPIPSPPPPSLSDIQESQINNIIDALIGAGDFAGWANLLSSADPGSLPLTATLFIPNNDAIAHLPSPNATAINFDPFLIPYHIVPQRLMFSDLRQLSTYTRLPTLLPSKYIVVTNNSSSNFSVDGSQITHPDIFVSGAFSVHGITNVLDYSVYGSGNEPHISPPPVNNRSSIRPPPNETKPVVPGEITFGAKSGASCCLSCMEFVSVFWLFVLFSCSRLFEIYMFEWASWCVLILY